MRKLFFKSLLVAAGLLMGSNVANAITETYSFNTWATADSYLTSGGEAGFTVNVPITNGTEDVTMYKITNPTLGGELRDFSRFAISDFKGKGNATKGFYSTTGGLRTGGSNQTTDTRQYGPFVFSVMDLYEGDKVTIQVSATRTTKLFTFRSANAKDASGNAVVAGTTTISPYNTTATYTMTADGHLDISCPDGCYVVSLSIETEHGSESIDTKPSISVTGADGGNRIITIESSPTNAGNATKTYYTKDGTEPTYESTLYSEPFAVTPADATDGIVTIKAITYKDGNTSMSSGVSTHEVTGVGTTLKLATPIIKLSDMTLDGSVYNGTYTFTKDMTGTIGTPTVTLEAKFNGTDISNESYTPTATGTITVVAKAAGYDDSDAAEVVVNKFGYLRVQYVDVADFYSVTERFQSGLAYDLIANVVFSRESDTKGCNFRKDEMAYYGRNSSFTATVSGLTEDMVAIFADYTNTVKYVVTADNNVATAPQNGTIKYYSLFALPTVTKGISVGDAGLATYTSDMSLDYSSISASLIPYKATVSDNTVTLTKATVVPAGEGVLLRSVSGEAVNNVAVPVATYSAWNAADNAFVGTVKAITVNETDGDNTNFVLSKEGNVVGFFKAATEAYGGTAVAAGKAYLPVATASISGARQMHFVFGDETTGISELNVNSSALPGNIYNIRGQRVAQPTKGLYIVNGKKVIVK